MAFDVQWSGNAESQRPLYAAQFDRWQDAIKGLEWGLSRRPWKGQEIAKSGVRVWSIGPFYRDKERESVKVFFKIVDSSTVEILWLELAQGN